MPIHARVEYDFSEKMLTDMMRTERFVVVVLYTLQSHLTRARTCLEDAMASPNANSYGFVLMEAQPTEHAYLQKTLKLDFETMPRIIAIRFHDKVLEWQLDQDRMRIGNCTGAINASDGIYGGEVVKRSGSLALDVRLPLGYSSRTSNDSMVLLALRLQE